MYPPENVVKAAEFIVYASGNDIPGFWDAAITVANYVRLIAGEKPRKRSGVCDKCGTPTLGPLCGRCKGERI